jgi:hypothetical protein
MISVARDAKFRNRRLECRLEPRDARAFISPNPDSIEFRDSFRVARDTSRTRSRGNLHSRGPGCQRLNPAGSLSCAGCGAHFNRQVNEVLHEEARPQLR